MGGRFYSGHLLVKAATLAVMFQGLSIPELAVSQVPITADTTTATQVISVDNQNFTIQQGTLRQGNLFHSFQAFSVPTGGSAQFNNPQVANIFARVTGVSVSDINGLIRTNGTANLILINPQGIQFGPNTFLSIGGSFLASTANAVVFNNNQSFSAVSPQPVPMLTINTPVGLQFGDSPGAIQVQSSFQGITVPSGQTLALVGGDVTLNRGSLTVPTGRIEIGSVAQAGQVSLMATSQPGGWQLGFGNITEFGDIQLLGEVVQFSPLFPPVRLGSSLNTSTPDSVDVSGDITLTGQNIKIVDGSQLQAGNFGVLPGGNIVLNATEMVTIEERPLPGVQSIPTGLFTATINAGRAGQISVDARNLTISGENVVVTASSTANVTLQNAGPPVVRPATGAAGNIQFNIAESITISDGATIGASSTFGVGTSGQIQLNTQFLNLFQGGRIDAFTTGPNPAGEIIINASEQVTIDGFLLSSGISSSLNSLSSLGASGAGGPITINTDHLLVKNGGVVSALTESIADAGSITVNAKQVSLLEGGQLISTTSSQGAAGQIQLNIQEELTIAGRDLTFPGRSQTVDELSDSLINTRFVQPIGVSAESGIVTSALANSMGSGGAIDITTGQLQVARQGVISSSTAGPGNAGNVDIRALQRVVLTDPGSGVFANTTDMGQGGPLSFFTPSFTVEKGATANVSSAGDGPGGNILVQANRFTARQGGQLLSTASGQGPAGDITLQVRDNITLTGANSGLFASTTPDSIGAAGNIFIDPIQVLIANGAVVSATSLGMGEGGDIQLRARNLTLDQGQITAEAAVAPAGNIQLNIDNFLLLRNGSLISTTAGGDATGGNIDINAQLVTAFPSENSDITANALNGPGGNITITTQGVFGLEVRDTLTNSSDITAFSLTNPQLNGIVEIITPEVDPSENLSEQPDTVEKPTEIAKGCKASTSSSSFVSKGRGGLPQHPAAALSGEAIWQDLRVQTSEQPVSQTTSQTTSRASVSALSQWMEAQTWQRLPNGKVKLVAHAVNNNSFPPIGSC